MTTHCQICGRLVQAKTGVIAHHGYSRPGDGWQTASCFGARYRPYEVACDALDSAVAAAQTYIAQRERAIADWTVAPPDTVTRLVAGRPAQVVQRPEGFVPGAVRGSYTPWQRYEQVYEMTVSKWRRDVAATHETITYLQDRKAKWKPAA